MVSSSIRLVFTTFEDRKEARRIARTLVEERLAACVNVGEETVTSFYRWEGEQVKAHEYAVTMKTHQVRLNALTERLRELHPYDCPEILVVSMDESDPDYEQWVHTSIRPSERDHGD